jgi:hypothetical protein
VHLPDVVSKRLRAAADSTLAMLRRLPPRGVSAEDLERGFASFERYMEDCLGRIDRMGKR